jgi:hypothetical protein
LLEFTQVAADVGTVVVGIVGIVVLWINSKQLRLSTEARETDATARTVSLSLELRKMLASYDTVHAKLAPGGQWADADGVSVRWARDKVSMTWDEWNQLPGPSTPEEWRQVEAYMGLFEQYEPMLRGGLIDLNVFKESFRYRLLNIMANRKIVLAKLGVRRSGWKLFIDLLRLMEIEVPPQENLILDY